MKKKQILFTVLVLSLLALPITILTHVPCLWAEDVKLKPVELDGTEWNVTMTSITVKGKKKSSDDKLIFSDKKFIAENFKSKGYSPTNYSATLQEDDSIKFGTMQVKGKETSFWRGIFKDGSIKGSVHTQFSGKDSTKVAYFTGTLIVEDPESEAEAEESSQTDSY